MLIADTAIFWMVPARFALAKCIIMVLTAPPMSNAFPICSSSCTADICERLTAFALSLNCLQSVLPSQAFEDISVQGEDELQARAKLHCVHTRASGNNRSCKPDLQPCGSLRGHQDLHPFPLHDCMCSRQGSLRRLLCLLSAQLCLQQGIQSSEKLNLLLYQEHMQPGTGLQSAITRIKADLLLKPISFWTSDLSAWELLYVFCVVRCQRDADVAVGTYR